VESRMASGQVKAMATSRKKRNAPASRVVIRRAGWRSGRILQAWLYGKKRRASEGHPLKKRIAFGVRRLSAALAGDRDRRDFMRLALEAVERHRPDLIIADIAMPEIDGYGFVRLLRGREAAPPPVIALSASPRQTVRTPELFSAYLNKPIEPEELVTAVWQCAGRAEAAG
jgi:CheY-like chemotaxis protein